MTKRRLFRIIAGASLLIFLIFTFVYHLPLDRSGTYTLTLLNEPHDKPVYDSVEMEITVHRSFFRAATVRGSIRMGNETYLDLQTKWSRTYDSYSFTENLRRKMNGSLNAWFAPEDAQNTEWMTDYILLGSEDYETFSFEHLHEGILLYRAERVE